MATALPLRTALARGAIVTLANWPVVLVDLVIESLYKVALMFPVIGGAFVVAALLGHDLQGVLSDGTRAAADLVVGSLRSAPIALVAFLGAVGIVGGGGAIVMFIVKTGALSILVDGERSLGDFPRSPLTRGWMRRARAYRLETLLGGTRRFAGRSIVLALWLGVAYATVIGAYLAVMAAGIARAADSPWGSVWPLLVLVATSAVAIGIALVNLAYDLLRIIIVTDDCRVRTAVTRLRAFLLADARQVIGIFAVMIAVLAVATAISLLGAWVLALVSWVPVIGIIVVPLQILLWPIRALVFEALALTALSAYQTQYRRFGEPQSALAVVPAQVQRA